MRLKRILITGGCGFIGSNFIRWLLKNKSKKITLFNLDKLTYAGHKENLEDIEMDKRYHFIKGDICCPRTVKDILKNKIDVLLNFAAETHVDRSITGPAEFIKTNIIGTHNLLEYAREFHVKRFIQISTDEVYGSIKKGSFSEKSPLVPSSPYSASKASADLLALSYYTTFNLPVIITRSSNNYGPYQFPEKLIPLFINRALRNKFLPLYGTGKNVRDWLFVEDNCKAITLVMQKGKPGEVYNIGANEEYSNIYIVKILLDLLQKPLSLIKYVKDRPGHDWRYSLTTYKIQKLGWKSKYKLLQGLKKTVEWYKNNQKWCEKVLKKIEK